MADFRSSCTVDADEKALFAYLSDLRNLPQYFSRLTSAEPGAGDEVHTTAQLPNGREVEGDAWFRTIDDAHRIEWGSEGESGYHGSLDVSGDGSGSRVDVELHTTRVEAGDTQVQDGLDQTVARIKELVEGASGA